MKPVKTRIVSFVLCVAFALTVWPLSTLANSIENIEEAANILFDFFQTELTDVENTSSETNVKNFITDEGDIVESYYYPTVADELEATVNSVKALKGAAGFLRRELGSRLKLRKVPELRFIADDSIEHSANISKIIDSFKEDINDEE